jgi:hypothetical protein
VSLKRVQSAASEFRIFRLAVVVGSRVQSAVPESRILGLVWACCRGDRAEFLERDKSTHTQGQLEQITQIDRVSLKHTKCRIPQFGQSAECGIPVGSLTSPSLSRARVPYPPVSRCIPPYPAVSRCIPRCIPLYPAVSRCIPLYPAYILPYSPISGDRPDIVKNIPPEHGR